MNNTNGEQIKKLNKLTSKLLQSLEEKSLTKTQHKEHAIVLDKIANILLKISKLQSENELDLDEEESNLAAEDLEVLKLYFEQNNLKKSINS